MHNSHRCCVGMVHSDTGANPSPPGDICCAGDQVGHLWWRLLHGQLPSAKPPKVVIVLIGTNDMGAITGTCPRRADSDIIAAVPGIASRCGATCNTHLIGCSEHACRSLPIADLGGAVY